MWSAFLASIFLLFGGWFHACVERLPPQAAQSDPGFFSRQADRRWRRLALALITGIQERRARLQEELRADVKALPPGSVELPSSREEDMATSGTYGQLPEVIVDQELGAIFPAQLGQPSRFSWYQTGLSAQQAWEALNRFESGLRQWRRLVPAQRIARFNELSDAWERITSDVAALAQQVRYLDTWVPQLSRQWRQSSAGSKPAQYLLISAIQQSDPRLMDALREVLRPARVLKPPYLPDELPKGIVILPIATDVTQRRFLSEIEGALATHWNQSSWARKQQMSFRIRWTRIPRDGAFARGKISLSEHLGKFPADQAAMTTGGLTTYVHQGALVLGPGKINPRTLAHELGHLMGFSDCYLRTLTSQGALGILGTAVLEWDNPLYPDDIMCDNAVGAARAEAW